MPARAPHVYFDGATRVAVFTRRERQALEPMFIGHYGVSLAAKRFAPRASLGALFLAVQALDIVFAVLVLAGVEKLRIVPGFTQVNPYELYFMPYSHSLTGAVLWSALGALAYVVLAGKDIKDPRVRVATTLVIAACVLSHFILDVPMHTPDLPLGFDGESGKVGLGLWNQVGVTMALEMGLLVAGGALYLGSTRPLEGGRLPTQVLAVLLVAISAATPFLPPPATAAGFAIQALGAYGVLAALAEWVDRQRVAVEPSL
jgi:hypothetical protein